MSIALTGACNKVLGLDAYHVTEVEAGLDATAPTRLPGPSAADGDAGSAPGRSTLDAAFDPQEGAGGFGDPAAPDASLVDGGAASSVVDVPPANGDSGDASAAADSPSEGLDAGDTSDAGAGVDASAADGGCSTAFLDGGGSVLFSFDDVAAATGWRTSGNAGVTASPGWIGSDGHSCRGAVAMTVLFQGLAVASPELGFAFSPATSWNATKLHVWMKLQVGDPTGYAALKAVQLFVQSSSFSRYSAIQIGVASTLGDGSWHEAVLNLQAPAIGPTVATASVNKLGAATIPIFGAPRGAPGPITTVLLLDDIWLE